VIISKTPIRISFFSGGSDISSFYEKAPGAALSVTIDKYIYVALHKTPHLGIKLMYDQVEEYSEIDQMQHLITRETLKHFDIEKELTIASISDITAKGSGLGSSSAFTVGLANVISAYKEVPVLKKDLADLACDIEIGRCKYPIGKQDQYAAAYGGFNLFEFQQNGTVVVNNIDNSVLDKLQENLILVYSGRGRSANAILQKQAVAMSNDVKFDLVGRSRDKAYQGLRLLNNQDVDSFGALLHEAWLDKKAVVEDISQTYFDTIYDRVLSAGALGGKLLGAGGGGFFLFYVPPEKREAVMQKLDSEPSCKVYDFKFSNYGSTITANC